MGIRKCCKIATDERDEWQRGGQRRTSEDTDETETECTTHNNTPTNMEMESFSAFVLVMLFL